MARASAVLAVLAWLSAPTPGAATPAPAASAADSVRCGIGVGSVSPTGAPTQRRLVATTPPTQTNDFTGPEAYWAGRTPRLSTQEEQDSTTAQSFSGSFVTIGDSLFRSDYSYDFSRNVVSSRLGRVGGGWSAMRAIEHSDLDLGAGSGVTRDTMYALGAHGTLMRWHLGASFSFGPRQSAAGFSPVKAMTLISQNSRYDTLLMNTRGGALYIVRIPVGSPMRPVVTVVRTTGWSSADVLLASPCGRYGTLLAAVDTDTASTELFAVGHAQGTSTVIQALGRAPQPVTGAATHEVTPPAWAGPPHNGD